MLEVSRARVSALIANGTLRAKWFGDTREVLIEDVERYRTSPRKVGRPAKVERELVSA